MTHVYTTTVNCSSLQLLLILCNLFLLFIAFTNTQPFKAGLLRLLVNCACFSLPTIASSTKLASGNGNSMPRARGATSNSAISASGDFNATVWMSVVYFGVCAGTRGYELQLLLACTASGLVCNPFGDLLFRLLYVLFRVTAVGYYFHFKRAIFAICDPKYYRVDSTWLKEKLRHLK